jgi:hypothetical protein
MCGNDNASRLLCGGKIHQCRLAIATEDDAVTQCPHYGDRFPITACMLRWA